MVTDTILKVLNSKYVEINDDDQADFGYKLIDEENTPQEIIDQFYEAKDVIIKYP